MVPGQNSLLVELYTHGGPLLTSCLLQFLIICWKTKQITKEWQMAKVIPIFEKGRNKYDNYRSISLLNTFMEICSNIVNARIKTLLKFYYQRNKADNGWIICL
jgi:hypothetical protein